MRKQLPLFLFLIILFSISLISSFPPVKATSTWTTPSAVHSKCGQTSTYTAIKAIDNDTGTYWNHNVNELHWIIFNMSTSQTITKIKLFQVSGYRWGEDLGLTVYVGDDPASLGTEVWNGTLNANGWQESGAFSKNGQYIKLVTKRGASYERMCEFSALVSTGEGTTLNFYDTFSLSPSITDGRRFSFSRQSSFSESFSYDVERSLIVSRKSIFSALFSINDGRLITLSRTSFFSQAFSIDTILSILKLNEYHFSTVITFSYSLTHGRSITIFRGSTFPQTFSIDHTFSLFQFGHYSFSSLFNVPFTIYDVVSSTAPYGMGDVIAIAILALIIAICAAVIAITWD